VGTTNVPEVAPSDIVTLGVTAAAPALEELRLTVTPLGPAGPDRVTVPAAVIPPTIEVGDKLSACSAGGSISIGPDRVSPPTVIEIIGDVFASTGCVWVTTDWLLCPPGMVIDVGTFALD